MASPQCEKLVKILRENRRPGRTPSVEKLRANMDRMALPPGDDDGFDRVRFLAALKAYLERRMLDVDWEAAKSAPAEALVNSLAMALPFDPSEKQALIEAKTLSDRRSALIALMEIDIAGRSGEDEPGPLQ